MEDYTIYSEDEYYDRMQLLSIYTPTVCNCIWEEIIKYRENFRYPIYFRSKNSYITLNKTLFQKMIRIYDIEDKEVEIDKKKIACYDAAYGVKELLLKYIRLNQKIMTQEMFKFLISDELFLLKVYIIYEYINDLNFLYLYLYLYKHSSWYEAIKKIEKKTGKNTDNADITKNFRDFLDSFYFNSSHNMIQLKGTAFEHMDVEELLALYPTCNEKQMNFYLKCCQKNHYYTISQYIKMNQVSYETARKAMEHLVELKFYHKIKVGKKFVFTPVD